METPTFDTLPAVVSEMREMLIGIKSQLAGTAKEAETDVWMSVDELQEYLPDKPARKTIYGWTHKKAIPYHKGPKKLRFRRSEIDAWLNSGGLKMKGEESV